MDSECWWRLRSLAAGPSVEDIAAADAGEGACATPSVVSALADKSVRPTRSSLDWCDVFGGRGQLQRSGEVGADAGGFFGGGDHPLIEGVADGAALGLVFDDDEANEVAARDQAGAHGILAREHAVEDEGHVVIFEELGYGEHAAGSGGSCAGESLPSFARPDRV